MDMKIALNSINWDKTDQITNSPNPKQAEKLYPAYVVNKSLSYSADSILYVNELNIRGLHQFNLTNKMQYDFLLNMIPKKKRYNKWHKPVKEIIIERVMQLENISYSKAVDLVFFMTESQKKEVIDMFELGGIVK